MWDKFVFNKDPPPAASMFLSGGGGAGAGEGGGGEGPRVDKHDTRPEHKASSHMTDCLSLLLSALRVALTVCLCGPGDSSYRPSRHRQGTVFILVFCAYRPRHALLPPPLASIKSCHSVTIHCISTYVLTDNSGPCGGRSLWLPRCRVECI